MAKTKAKFSCGHKSDQRPTIEPMGGKTEETYSCRCEPCPKREALNLQKAIHDRNKAKNSDSGRRRRSSNVLGMPQTL